MKRRKIYSLVLIIALVFAFFVPSFDVSAKTIADFRSELQELKDEQSAAESNKEAIQEQIDETNREINDITLKIANATKEQESLNKEIAELEKKISEKEQQIKDLASFFQLSSNENFYLKYLFGADNFTDFIYRFSVIEQLTTKSNELVTEMNSLIDQNKIKISELDDTKKSLAELNSQAQAKISSLGTKKSVYIEEAESYDTQIASVQAKIDDALSHNCGENEQLTSCYGSAVPYDYGFNKPLTHGVVTDEYGMRYHPTLGYWKLHSGIDLGGNREGTDIYAPAAGKVVRIVWKNYCGGNQVYINHMIDGVPYTTQYMHMLTINVSVGDIVGKGDVIGTVGGGAGTSSYETCSTGAHLHFMVAKGHYYGDDDNDSYSSYSTYVDKLMNPRDMLYFPNYGVWW